MVIYTGTEKLECQKCRKEIIILRPGKGNLICCGEAMATPVLVAGSSKETKILNTALEGFVIDRDFVLEWSARYGLKNQSGENSVVDQDSADWMFKEKEKARTTLQKAGLWKREFGDTSDAGWLEYVKIMRDLSISLNVNPRELGKALFAYEIIGIDDKRCPYCIGTGKVESPSGGFNPVICPVCKGRRYNFIPVGFQICNECYGAGEFIDYNAATYSRNPCGTCKGTGWTAKKG